MTRRTTIRIEEPEPPMTADRIGLMIMDSTRAVLMSGLNGDNLYSGSEINRTLEVLRLRNPETPLDLDLAHRTRTEMSRVLRTAVQRAETEARYR